MATRGLCVHTLDTGEICGVQVRDDTGMTWSIDPDTYKLRGYEPAIDSLPDVKDYDGRTFDVQKVLGGAQVHCREARFTPTIEGAAPEHSRYALTGRVTCATGGMTMCWLSDGSAVRQSSVLFQEHPDSDFDLSMDV